MNRTWLLAGGIITLMLISVAAVFLIPHGATGTGNNQKLDAAIRVAEVAQAKDPTDVTAATTLSELYFQKVRETADTSYFSARPGWKPSSGERVTNPS